MNFGKPMLLLRYNLKILKILEIYSKLQLRSNENWTTSKMDIKHLNFHCVKHPILGSNYTTTNRLNSLNNKPVINLDA